MTQYAKECKINCDKQDILNNIAQTQFILHSHRTGLDPLVRMAIIHHQFESIHPFTDGNGRAGRILNTLYLAHNELISSPILSMSVYTYSSTYKPITGY